MLSFLWLYPCLNVTFLGINRESSLSPSRSITLRKKCGYQNVSIICMRRIVALIVTQGNNGVMIFN